VEYNHYSLLRSIEDIFGLPHLAEAAMARVKSFGPDVFGWQMAGRARRGARYQPRWASPSHQAPSGLVISHHE